MRWTFVSITMYIINTVVIAGKKMALIIDILEKINHMT